MGLLSVAGVQVDISGNLEPLRRDIQTAERELGSFARGISGSGTGPGTGTFNAATSSANSFFGALRSGAQDIFFMANAANTMYSAFSKPFKAADDLAQMGYAAERARIALTNATGSATEYEKWVRAIKDATHGTVTEMEAAGLGYQTLRLGLAQTSEEAQEFVRVATIIGQASPQLSGASDAISEIGLTIANMSWRRLDQLGLSVSEVKGRMEDLRRLNTEMTTEEAFQVAVMEGLTEQANMLGDEILEVGANTQRWKIYWNDLKTDIGWKIGEGFDGAIIAVESMIEIMHVLTDDPWKIRIIAELAGLPQWAIDALEASGTGQGDITNRYDATLGRQQSQIRGGMYPALPGGALNAPTPLPPPTPDMRAMQTLAQLQMYGGYVDPQTLVDINAYYDAYYAAQEDAVWQSKQDSQERLFRMYGTGGGLDTLMLISGLELRGAGLAPEVSRNINAYYDAYYAAQERAIAQAGQRSRSRITRYLPGYQDMGAAARGNLPQFPTSSYAAMMTQHGMPGTQFFPSGLGLPTDRSGRPIGYEDWYWEQYYTQGGWQGGGVQAWEIDPRTRRDRERIAANQARYEERRRQEQMRAFREADAASYAEPRRGRFPGLGIGWYGVAEAGQMLPDMVEILKRQQAYEDMLTRRAAPPRAQSLDELFKISPERLDTEVYGVMANALRDVGVNADVAAEALKLFEWQTGMTTPTAELFNAQVDVLTQKLNTGQITAAEFASSMALLAQTDLSPLSLLWEADLNAGDWEAVTNTIERLSKINLDFLHLMTTPMTEAGLRTDTEAMMRDMWEPGEEVITAAGPAGSPLQQLANDAFAARDALQTMSDEGVTAAETFAVGATNWFETWSTESLTYVDTLRTGLDNIEEKIARLTMVPFVITLNTNIPTDGGGEGGEGGGEGSGATFNGRERTFALGGYTGDGPVSEVAGIVHRGEYVVPKDGALVMRDGGGSAPTIIVQQLNTFGDWRGAVRQLEQAAQDAGYRMEVRR